MTKHLPIKKVIPLMLIYCVIIIIGMYHHELWFDEVQHFLLARDSKSIHELIQNSLYDDHVALWKILLFMLTHFISDNPIALQALHFIVIITAVFIFLRYAPFNFIAKILILLGYYFIFEYSILCRNYAIDILFLFIICKLLSKPDKNLIKVGVLLICMCNTHEFFFFASISIFLYLLYYNYDHKSLNTRFLLFSFLFLIGFLIVVFHIYNAELYTSIYHTNKWWLTVHNISFAVHGIDKGFIPLPPLHDPNFWNRHMFEGWSSFIKVPLSLLFLLYPVWIIRNSRKALIFYTSASFFLLLFLTRSQMTGSRYYGMFFIYFIVAIWLADYDGINVLFIDKDKKRSIIDVATICIFYIILLVQIVAGAFIYEQDYTRPFSQGKNTVKFIQSQHLDSVPIVVDGYNAGPTLSAYFRHPVYYLDIDTIGSYCWDNKALDPVNRKSLIQEMKDSKYIPTIKEFILISDRPNCDSEINQMAIFYFVKINSFQNAIIPIENYYVYNVTKKQDD